MIQNEKNIKITKTEIYPNVFSYRLEDGYHFESYGTDYGQTVYGGETLENPYTIKQNETDNNTITTNTKQDNG